jgi:uncharacterized protein
MIQERFFVGRKEHLKAMQGEIKSKISALVTVLGRRRVGKTFFVKEALKKEDYFHFTGVQNVSRVRLLEEFSKKVETLNNTILPIQPPIDWYEAFALLRKALIAKYGKRKKIIFLDEFPWMDTKGSNFVSAFEYFWNDWAVDNNVLIVICGSSTSWMMQYVMRNTGGLHNRVSAYFRIEPFTLSETQQYFQKKGINLSVYDVAQFYMALGGIPHYLNMINVGETFPIAIDRLFFEKNAPLQLEYDQLYKALFQNFENYELIVRVLARQKKGLTRLEIIDSTKIANGGGLTKVLNELNECGFIQFVQPMGKKKVDGLYKLVDEYSLFYNQFVSANVSKGQFISIFNTPRVRSWLGLAFENLCIKHVDKIKQKLGISGVFTQTYSYVVKANDVQPGFQIDMLVDRADNAINICEIKFYQTTYALTQNDSDTLRDRVAKFIAYTNTKKNIMTLFISPFGILENKYSKLSIHQEVTLEDLMD